METVQEVGAQARLSLDELVAEARRQMQATGYSLTSLRHYGAVWEKLQCFARQGETREHFSIDLAERFLADQGYSPEHPPRRMPAHLKHSLLALRLLTELHARGRIKPRRYPDRRLSLCTHFREVLATYEHACQLAGRRPTTLRCYRQHLPTFLLFVQSAGVEQVSRIRPAQAAEFLVTQRHHCPGSLGLIASTVRCFLRYLYRGGLLPEDLACAVPKIRLYRQAKIPAVWTAEEVERLLAQVDRGSPKGKRDYAILLLAARLGLRVGDIVRLRLEHLKWDEQRIEVPQSKTNQPLVLPLSDDVGWALIDYLRHGRPSGSHREVFLQCLTPFAPFVHEENLQHIITKYRRRAGIIVPPKHASGLHSLRHSLATRLLSSGTPLATIADILGHTSSASAQIYTKVDLPHLQTCALDPEEARHA
jgi:site-specific recombinase XerD